MTTWTDPIDPTEEQAEAMLHCLIAKEAIDGREHGSIMARQEWFSEPRAIDEFLDMLACDRGKGRAFIEKCRHADFQLAAHINDQLFRIYQSWVEDHGADFLINHPGRFDAKQEDAA